jgi:hypothetical protein
MQGRNNSHKSCLSYTSDFRSYAKNVRKASIWLW